MCDQHEQTDLSSCTCQALGEVENCQSVWSSGGSNSGDGSNGNNTGDDNNNGGSSNNEEEECTTSGTVIIDDEPSSNIGEECTPNESVGVLSPALNDCEKLSNLANSASFQLRMQELIENTTGNTEIVYYGRINNSNGHTTYDGSDRYESNPDIVGVDIPNPTSSVDSYIHNHFNNGTGCLSVFSGSDLYSVYQLYINEKINDLKSFTLVVTSPGNSLSSDEDDTVYAITIDNETDFIEFGAFYLSDYLLADAFFANNGIKPFISNNLNEERLSRLLKEKNIGMKLFRGNKDNLNDWTEIKIRNNNSLIEKPCN